MKTLNTTGLVVSVVNLLQIWQYFGFQVNVVITETKNRYYIIELATPQIHLNSLHSNLLINVLLVYSFWSTLLFVKLYHNTICLIAVCFLQVYACKERFCSSLEFGLFVLSLRCDLVDFFLHRRRGGILLGLVLWKILVNIISYVFTAVFSNVIPLYQLQSHILHLMITGFMIIIIIVYLFYVWGSHSYQSYQPLRILFSLPVPSGKCSFFPRGF